MLLLITNRKSHMRFRLTPRSVTLDNIELLQVKIFWKFCVILQTRIVSDGFVTH